MCQPQTRMNSTCVRYILQETKPAFNPYHTTHDRSTTNKTNRIHQHAFFLRVGRREKNGRHFLGIKRESWRSMPYPIQPLAVAADVAAAVAPAAAVVLIPLVLSISPTFSSITTTVPGPSSQRIGVSYPFFPGSKGYVGAPYRPQPPCSSDTCSLLPNLDALTAPQSDEMV